MVRYCTVLFTVAVGLLSLFACGSSGDADGERSSPENSRAERQIPGIPFAWPFKKLKEFQPRGGTTRGTEVTPDKDGSDHWKNLQRKDLSKKEKDRRAILAMTGAYRVSFQFTETMGFSPDYEPPRPYFSWATEYIDVLKQKENRIRLQHTLVMYFQSEDGSVKGPKVMKHWRQDWRYEDRNRLAYLGDRIWKRKQLPSPDVEDRWTQTVYQVDDAPRYEAFGRWTHEDGTSTWKSETFRRPLPRREFSVRDDYDLLKGINTITITPHGWVHEQRNAKIKRAGGETENGREDQAIAREIGINRYQRITEPDLAQPASRYWNRTGGFWSIVRGEWASATDDLNRFRLKEKVDGKKLHRHLFQRARQIKKEDNFDRSGAAAFVRELLSDYVVPVEAPPDADK